MTGPITVRRRGWRPTLGGFCPVLLLEFIHEQWHQCVYARSQAPIAADGERKILRHETLHAGRKTADCVYDLFPACCRNAALHFWYTEKVECRVGYGASPCQISTNIAAAASSSAITD